MKRRTRNVKTQTTKKETAAPEKRKRRRRRKSQSAKSLARPEKSSMRSSNLQKGRVTVSAACPGLLSPYSGLM
jgi:hypothetical protein